MVGSTPEAARMSQAPGAWKPAAVAAWLLGWWFALGAAADLDMACPEPFRVFAVAQFDVRLAGALAQFTALPDDQVNDAYDADRDGVFLRLRADFASAADPAHPLRIPGFAMRDSPLGPWHLRVRWSPTRPGPWRATLRLDGCARRGATAVHAEQELGPFTVEDRADAEGPLVAGSPWLRELRSDGSSVPRWLFGACRAWVVGSDPKGAGWEPFESIDRERELFPVLRANGYNLLNQWMAPWEYQLVHRDRAEQWREPGGAWTRHALPEQAAWTPWLSFDQGRAMAFDELVRQCEGGPGRPAIRLLLAPLPHKCVAMRSRNWPAGSSNWSPEDDGSGQSAAKLCGFSAFSPAMSAWEFFAADPRAEHDGARARQFDAQAGFWRYVVARWSASRAIGLWVLMDEIDAVGDQLGIAAEPSGWFAHPECEAWLASTTALLRGGLVRGDGLAYDGDPYRHPLHASTTSIGSEFRSGANLEWDWKDAAPRSAGKVVGWHWYPRWQSGSTYDDAWRYAVDGIAAFSSRAQGDGQPRLIGEFGSPDRQSPEDEPTPLYPTLYHMGIWAAIFSGQAGTVMDWDDGKEFGEVRWRDAAGVFDREHYPVDNAGQLKALRAVLDRLDAERLRPCTERSRLRVLAPPQLRAFALGGTQGTDEVHAWVLAPARAGRVLVAGLGAGRYRLEFDDPWTGAALTACGRDLVVAANGLAAIDLGPALAAMRPAEDFPQRGRLDRGKDAVFHLVAQGP
jgi:hypothetical protein